MLLCLCFPSAALTLDNRLGLSEDELEELSLTESMEDGDALETYLEHEEDRYLEHEEDLAQLEEMKVQDPNVKARRRRTRKGGARRRRRSMAPGEGKPVKLTIGKRVKALEKKNKVLSTQVLKLKGTVKSHSAEIPHLKGVIEKLVAAVDDLEQAIGNGNNDENDNENNNNNDENDNDNNNNNDEPAPAPAPTEQLPCGGMAKIDFSKSKVVHSNLGGFGPQLDKPEEVRYGHVGVSPWGRPFDLVVTSESKRYRTPQPQGNNIFGDFAHLTLATGSGVDLLMRFIDSETNASVVFPKFYITFFDIDAGNPDNRRGAEQLVVKDCKQHFVSDNTELYISKKSGFGSSYTSFKATRYGTGADNPRSPLGLTGLQKRRTVSVLFTNTDRFKASYLVSQGGLSAGRDIYFAGVSDMYADPCPTAETTTVPITTTTELDRPFRPE